MPPTLYLIDGHALAYRTYFALSGPAGGNADRWLTKAGEPTAGVYGFASVLLRLLDQETPDYLAVAFDTGKTFRDQLFKEYKGTRAKMPDDLRAQIERIRQLVDSFNIPRLEVEGFEADDVLGSVARQASALGLGVKIITGDRDLLQLVDERIVVSLAGSKLSESRDFTPEDVKAYLGVRPEQVVDYKALVGDTSDNIPGVPGVGEKTALSLLETYPTLDEIYAHLAELPNRVRTKLETGRDLAELSRKLATIVTDVKVSLDLDQARTSVFEPAAVESMFRELEFRSLMDRLHAVEKKLQPHEAPQQLSLMGEEITRVGIPAPAALTVHIVNTPEALSELSDALKATSIIAFDTESTSIDPLRADLVGISLAVHTGEAYYIPVGHHRQPQGQLTIEAIASDKPEEAQLPLQTVLDALRGPFTDPKIGKVGHNLKYDALMLSCYGLTPTPLTFDTMLAEWLVDPASRNLGLKNLAWVRLGREMTHIEALIGKGKNQRSMADVDIAEVAPYAAADAETVLALMPTMQKELTSHHADRLLQELEMPLVSILASMEEHGIALDVPFFRKFGNELRQRMGELENQIYELAGGAFNINSTQQLSAVLFERLRLEPPDRRKRTASGHFSTSADVLDELRGKHPVVDAVLEYRELAKLKSTYVDALPEQINPRDGRVHTSYNQTGSVTGRLASQDPNLQNIPTRTDLGRQVRQGFVADPGNVLLSVDYSQIELRIVAHMAGDEAMLAAFRAGQDIHATTAAAIYGVSLDQVTREQRRHAKAINFGLIYGMSSFGLSRSTDLTLGEAENFVKAYFERFPGVKSYLDGMRRQAATQGYVETLLGRRRYFPGL
ncbi:MAG: DNA polymerase I [Anaerolineaceae bacterium]